MLFTTVTFWVIVVVVLGIILKVTFGVGAPRPVTTLVSYAFVGVDPGVLRVCGRPFWGCDGGGVECP